MLPCRSPPPLPLCSICFLVTPEPTHPISFFFAQDFFPIPSFFRVYTLPCRRSSSLDLSGGSGCSDSLLCCTERSVWSFYLHAFPFVAAMSHHSHCTAPLQADSYMNTYMIKWSWSGSPTLAQIHHSSSTTPSPPPPYCRWQDRSAVRYDPHDCRQSGQMRRRQLQPLVKDLRSMFVIISPLYSAYWNKKVRSPIQPSSGMRWKTWQDEASNLVQLTPLAIIVAQAAISVRPAAFYVPVKRGLDHRGLFRFRKGVWPTSQGRPCHRTLQQVPAVSTCRPIDFQYLSPKPSLLISPSPCYSRLFFPWENGDSRENHSILCSFLSRRCSSRSYLSQSHSHYASFSESKRVYVDRSRYLHLFQTIYYYSTSQQLLLLLFAIVPKKEPLPKRFWGPT